MAVGQAFVEEMKTGENASGSVGHCLEAALSGTRPKADESGGKSGWTLKECSVFGLVPGMCPKDLCIFSRFHLYSSWFHSLISLFLEGQWFPVKIAELRESMIGKTC